MPTSKTHLCLVALGCYALTGYSQIGKGAKPAEGATPAAGEVVTGDYADPAKGIALTTSFTPDVSQVMVGEPLFLTCTITNRGTKAFHFKHLEDEIFHVSAVDANGRRAKTLGISGDGFPTEETVPVGTTYTARVYFNQRCVLEEPGEYVVTCGCNFFGGSDLAAPPYIAGVRPPGLPMSSTFRLTVLPATPERLTAVIERWGAMVKKSGAALNEAATALSAIDDPRRVAFLVALLKKTQGRSDADRRLRYSVVTALGRYPDEAAADALTDELARYTAEAPLDLDIRSSVDEEDVAQAAGTSLRNTHQGDRAAVKLMPGLTSTNSTTRSQSARAVSFTGSALAFDPLCTLLEDPNRMVRCIAARAVGRLGDPRSYGVLLKCLDSPAFSLRIAAVGGMIELGRKVDAAWVKPMILAGDGTGIGLLKMYGDANAAAGLASCLHFDDPSVKNTYNFGIILALEYMPNGAKYYSKWHCDPNREGTAQELADNKQVLSDLKAWLEKQTPAASKKGLGENLLPLSRLPD